jgi:hypothetical protein
LASNYSLGDTTHSATIAQKALTVTGSSAAGKTYDATTAATITVGTLSGTVGSETVTASATGTFDSANAGSRTATAAYSLVDGTGLAANYSLGDTTHSATIAQKALAVTGSSAAGKTYDATTAATITVGTLSGTVGSETVIASAVGTFDSANAGTRTATAAYSLVDGTGLAANYSLADTTHTATIAPAPVLLSAVPQTSTYDGVSTYASLAEGGAYRVSGLLGSDAVGSLTFSASKSGLAQAGNFVVVPGAVSLSQGELGNYSFTYGFAAYTVNQALLRITATSASKAFDGTVASAALPQVTGLLGSDRVLNLSQAYDSASAGTDKFLRVVSGYTISDGNNGGNYIVTVADNAQGVISQDGLTSADTGASVLPVLAPTAVPRFPGAIKLRPSLIDLPMPKRRGRSDLGLDGEDDEKIADQPQLQDQSPG